MSDGGTSIYIRLYSTIQSPLFRALVPKPNIASVFYNHTDHCGTGGVIGPYESNVVVRSIASIRW